LTANVDAAPTALYCHTAAAATRKINECKYAGTSPPIPKIPATPAATLAAAPAWENKRGPANGANGPPAAPNPHAAMHAPIVGNAPNEPALMIVAGAYFDTRIESFFNPCYHKEVIIKELMRFY
jgi:hypothetical protein